MPDVAAAQPRTEDIRVKQVLQVSPRQSRGVACYEVVKLHSQQQSKLAPAALHTYTPLYLSFLWLPCRHVATAAGRLCRSRMRQ